MQDADELVLNCPYGLGGPLARDILLSDIVFPVIF